MGNNESKPKLNTDEATIKKAIESMQIFLDKVGNHQEVCNQVFAPNTTAPVDPAIKKIREDLHSFSEIHQNYMRDLGDLLDKYQGLYDELYQKTRKSSFISGKKEPSSLYTEFFSTFGLCNEILVDLGLTQTRFPKSDLPTPRGP